MAEAHDLDQLVLAEVVRAQPGIEARQAEVDGIRAIGDGRAQRIPVAGGGEEFRMRQLLRGRRHRLPFTEKGRLASGHRAGAICEAICGAETLGGL